MLAKFVISHKGWPSHDIHYSIFNFVLYCTNIPPVCKQNPRFYVKLFFSPRCFVLPAPCFLRPAAAFCLPPRLAPVSAFAESTGAEAGEASRSGTKQGAAGKKNYAAGDLS